MESDKSTIVIALDFGTTYSGVAWARIINPEDHFVIEEWPRSISDPMGRVNSEKVPTELAYNCNDSAREPIWGFAIPDIMPRFQWIKLGLDPSQKSGLENCGIFAYKDSRQMQFSGLDTAETVTTDYLRQLIAHTRQEIKRRIGNTFNSMETRYVITVPAVWSDKAKSLTRLCAEKAGMGSVNDIQMISEPEAAAIFSLNAQSPQSLNLKVGDTIVICDAGGGTVDLITFTIIQLEPVLRLEEAAPGNGGLCGSTFIYRRFERLLLQRLSHCEGWERDTLDQAMTRFEAVAKMFGGDTHDGISVPVPGIANDSSLNVRRGFLHISGTEMREIFLPVLQEIRNLVKQQFAISRKDVSSVFLVGGFGQNRFLEKYLRDSLPPNIELIAPVKGWTAVVRGALTKVLANSCTAAPQVNIISRRARRHYGQIIRTPFLKGVHDKKKRYWDYFYGEYYIDVMSWFINKGDTLNESKPIKTEWVKQSLTANGKIGTIRTRIYEVDTCEGVAAPLYFNHSIKEFAVLEPQLDSILRKQIPTVKGKDGKSYYQVQYGIHAHHFSAHCEYSLWFQGQNQGSVRVQYT